jgi:polyisoprenoid-binding protein YceI
MSMSRIVLFVLSFLLFSTQLFAAPENYTFNPEHTYPHFAVSHMGFSTTHGRFNKASGKFMLDQTAKTGALELVIETASIDTGLPKRDDHLRSPDFFNTAEFPKATYKSTAVKFNGDRPASVEGNLTLLGVTKPVMLTITTFKCGVNPMNKKTMCGADATAKIKRSDFGMTFSLPAVGDDIALTIEAEAYKD